LFTVLIKLHTATYTVLLGARQIRLSPTNAEAWLVSDWKKKALLYPDAMFGLPQRIMYSLSSLSLMCLLLLFPLSKSTPDLSGCLLLSSFGTVWSIYWVNKTCSVQKD